MNDKMTSAAIKLALCPGTCNDSKICMICSYHSQSYCAAQLKTEALTLLQEYEASKQMSQLKSCNLKSRVTAVMHEIGIPAHLLGHRYLRFAIQVAVNDISVLSSVTRDLYPAVAKEFQTTPGRVERAIRHAIEVAWDRGDLDTLQQWFGWTVSSTKCKPTNSEFIAMIADKLLLETEKEGH